MCGICGQVVACGLAVALALTGCGKSEREDDTGEAGEAGRAGEGSGGRAGTPNTSNVSVSEVRQKRVGKLDLLLMIDNSLSMDDKQRLLADAVPVLIERLIAPPCVNGEGQVVARPCPPGFAPEFPALEDIHIGIITSSLGHLGSKDVCSDTTMGRTPDDKGQLLPSVRPSDPPLEDWNGQGFLVWDPRSGGDSAFAHAPPGWGASGGPGDANDLVRAFADQVRAVGELGCGYEQQLEAWYRFLVDPEPVASMDHDNSTSVRVKDGSGKTIVNETVLAQRAAFLRRDSLLVIAMITDENDCSILAEDGTYGWLVGYKGGPTVNNWRMPAATASCKRDPNDACCRPCIEAPEPGCGDNAAEGCPESGYLSVTDDSMNQRCHQQVQRFGLDLLYPTARYVEAITSPFIDPRLTGTADQLNPLYAPGPLGEPARELGSVLLTGIVGVPWQDIATDGNVPVSPQPPDSLTDPRALVYLTAAQLAELGRWDVILGDPGATPPVLPSDPLMIESIDPRSGEHPFLPVAIVPPGGAASNPINGNEQAVDPAARDDLQYACIFDLEEPVPCTETNAAGCECNAEELVKQSPLCTYPEGSADGVQIKAKAYPSLRQLEVLRGVGEAAVVASICPKNIAPQGSEPAADPYYGYNPAVAAITDRLKGALSAGCMPRPLEKITQEDVDFDRAEPEEVGMVPCTLVEVTPRAGIGGCPACDTPGRAPLAGSSRSVLPALEDYLAASGRCGGSGLPDCGELCSCEIRQLSGAQQVACRTEAVTAGLDGYCYVDPEGTRSEAEADGSVSAVELTLIEAEAALTASCHASERRLLRILGENLPAANGVVLLACEATD